jgi:hypothetical protein
MIGKGSEAIQRQQQRQQSTKRWSGMEAWSAMVNGEQEQAMGNGNGIASNNQPNDGAPWSTTTATAHGRQF